MMSSSCSCCDATGVLFSCSRCKTKRYCSKTCQSADWSKHKASCFTPDRNSQMNNWWRLIHPDEKSMLRRLMGEANQAHPADTESMKREFLSSSKTALDGEQFAWISKFLAGNYVQSYLFWKF